MFKVYTRPGDFEAGTVEEVLDLFERYPFITGDDFFTVSRDDIDFLEIFKFNDGFSLAYIPPDHDESTPLPGRHIKQTVLRVLIAFVEGDPDWPAELDDPGTAPPDWGSDAVDVNYLNEEYENLENVSSKPIRPSGCLSVLLLPALILLALLLI